MQGAHHRGDLRDSLGGHAGLVEEDAPEVVAVWEDLVLEWEERTARVDEVDAREVVLLGDLLRAQVLLDRQRKVRATLDGGVVCNDHAFLPLDDADPRDHSGRRCLALVQLPGGEGSQLEERASRIEEAVYPLTGRELAARPVALDRLVPAAPRNLCGALSEAPPRERPSARWGREDIRLALDL